MRGRSCESLERPVMNALSFLPGPNGALACRYWAGDPQRTPVLLLPPLHEEMNRARVQMRRIAEHLQARGHSVLLGDLSGTGDSAGEFGEASLSRWRADVDALFDALAADHAAPPVALALRGGALLIPLRSRHQIACFPIASGRRQLQQWLRQALFMARFKGADIDQAALLARWRSEGIEVAGYALSPQMLEELESAAWPEADDEALRHVIEWQQPQPAAAYAAAQAAGRLHWRSLSGPAFWQTPETTVIDALPEALAAWMPA
jgi:exosortase A-associated hydrolase 2